MIDADSPIKILHLEDDPADAEIVHEKLRSAGLHCAFVTVDNKERFETALTESRFDIVFTDFSLPDYDGITALKLVLEVQPNTPVIMISGSLGEYDAIKSMQLGATDYLLKQQLERLPSALIRALDEATELRKRELVEVKLKESEERFRQLAEQSSEGFWFVELNPVRFIYWSNVSEQISGVSAETMLADPTALMTVCHPDDLMVVKSAWESVLTAHTDRFEREFRIVRPNGDIRWIMLAGTGIKNAQGDITRYGGIIQDITSRKQTELHTLRTQRLESIGTLAGGLAHDLNNALSPIMMIVDLLRRKNPESLELLDTIYSSAKRGADMVKQLLTFAKGVEGERLLIQPKHLLKEVLKIIKSTFPKSIEVHTNIGKDLWTIQGDATQLHQVLLNLCVNARDAMPMGGTLTLEAENAVIDSTFVSTMHDSKAGQYVVCRVIDSGTGMDHAVLDRIFEPYFTTKALNLGTGLGLSTSLGIIQSHGGFVQVYSVTEQGSTFSVYLPVHEIIQVASAPVVEESDFQGNGELILIVEDEAEIRSVLCEVLSELNFRSVSANDGADALAQVADHKKELRLVITDVHMPNMEGSAFVKVLRRMMADVPIIVMSGHLEERAINEFNNLGVMAFLNKPFSQDDLVKILRRVFSS